MSYVPISKDRSLVPTKVSKKEIRSEKYELLAKLIENVGEWNINISDLSKTWRIPETTLRRWKDKIVTERGILDIKKVGDMTTLNMRANINLLQKKIHASDNMNDICKGILTLNNTIKTNTEFLEAYGYKEKIAEKNELSFTNNAFGKVTINILSVGDKKNEEKETKE